MDVSEKQKEKGDKEKVEDFFDLSKLLQQLEDGNPELREKAIIVLADYAWIIQKFYEVPGKLEELLNDQSPKVRASAAYAIGKYAEGGLVGRIIPKKLVELLADENEYVIQKAADALTKYHDKGLMDIAIFKFIEILKERPSIAEKSYLPERILRLRSLYPTYEKILDEMKKSRKNKFYNLTE